MNILPKNTNNKNIIKVLNNLNAYGDIDNYINVMGDSAPANTDITILSRSGSGEIFEMSAHMRSNVDIWVDGKKVINKVIQASNYQEVIFRRSENADIVTLEYEKKYFNRSTISN